MAQPVVQPALISFVVAHLNNSDGNLASWAHDGRVLEKAWSGPSGGTQSELEAWKFAFQLNGTLAELGWGGWKAIGMPVMFKATGRLADQLHTDAIANIEPTTLLFAFLASLRRMKRLAAGDTDLVWRTRLEKLATRALQQYIRDDITKLNDDLVCQSPTFVHLVAHLN